jgi:branched-chain amino acid transport system permease protein
MAYITHLLILISLWSMLAVSLNLVIGFTGLLSITHAAFFGIGAYATAILMTSFGINFFVGLVVGVVVSMFVAWLISLVMRRFSGDYYALVSFGFNIIVFSIFLNWQEVTRGPLGIPGIKRPEVFGFFFRDNLHFLLLVAVVAALLFALARYITRSSLGRALTAIREDEIALQVFGYKTEHYKTLVFMVAAGMAAIAGSFFASYITFIDPSTFDLQESIFILAIIILGGLASHKGAFWGTVFLILLPEVLRFVGFPTDIAAQMRQVVYGLLLVFLMMYRPQGMFGTFKL